ncbi:hypothetical protein ACOKFD_03755 [Flagellimonas sp. S174]|uniref:hypothetical protein n=1 Tax=Flagellimonas sp. S174 TaxID=3410790 RepID=UPI003BF5369C
MKTQRIVAAIFLLIAMILGFYFHSKIQFPTEIGSYFRIGTYNQFGPLAISIELLVAGYYLFVGHKKTNFALALFAFTALLDPFFNFTGLFTSLVPIYATIIFVVCALIALWIAFSNTFGTGRISFLNALGSFILGAVLELFFNYL